MIYTSFYLLFDDLLIYYFEHAKIHKTYYMAHQKGKVIFRNSFSTFFTTLHFCQFLELPFAFIQYHLVFMGDVFHKSIINLFQSVDIVLCPLQDIRSVFFRIPGNNDLQSFLHNLYIYILSHHHRVAVKVDYPRFRTVNTECLATERLNPAVLVNGLVEELERERRYIEHSERLEYGDVQQSVVQGGLWGNIRIVSILRCVSAGYQERLVSQLSLIHI